MRPYVNISVVDVRPSNGPSGSMHREASTRHSVAKRDGRRLGLLLHAVAKVPRRREGSFTLPRKLAVHHSQISMRVPAWDRRLREIVEARGRLVALREERRAVSTGE